MKKILFVGILLMSLSMMAQTAQEQQSFGATMPSAAFHSTGSTMMNSGSTYSANPTLSADGMASYSGASYSPASMPSGPRRASAFDDLDAEDMPLGDALLPLMLMAFAFMGIIYLRRKKIP